MIWILLLLPIQLYSQGIASFDIPTVTFLLRDVRAPITEKMIDVYSNFRQEITTSSIQFITTENSLCNYKKFEPQKTIFTVDFNISDSRISLEYKGCTDEVIMTEVFDGLKEGFSDQSNIHDILRGDIDLQNPNFERYHLFIGKNVPFFSFSGSSYTWGLSEFLKIRKEENKSVFLIIPFQDVISIPGNVWISSIGRNIQKLEVINENTNYRFFNDQSEISALQFTNTLQGKVSGGAISPIKMTKKIINTGIHLFFPVTKVATNPAASQQFLNELVQMRKQVNQGQTNLVLQKINEFISAITSSKIIIQDKRN